MHGRFERPGGKAVSIQTVYCDFSMELSLTHATGSKVQTLRPGDVKSLLLEHEGLSSNPLHTHKKTGIKLMVMPLLKTTLT